MRNQIVSLSSTRLGVLVVLAASLPATAASQPSMKTHAEVKHDVSMPLRDMRPRQSSKQRQWFDPDMQERRHSEDRFYQGEPSRVEGVASKAMAATGQALAPAGPTTGLSFDGLIQTSGWSVPDTNGAAGATQFVEWVNTDFAVYNKSNGALVYGPVAGNTLWSGFGGGCENDNNGDVIAEYDKPAGRWVMMQHAILAEPYEVCIAVSTTSDATGSYYRYAFPVSTNFTDYAKLAVWPDAYYITSNLQDSSFNNLGAQVCAVDRTQMLAGNAATSICFSLSPTYLGLLPSDLDGTILPPSGAPNYLFNLGTNSLNEWKFHVDFATPTNSTLTGPVNVPVFAFNQACGGGVCVPQPGTAQTLDSVGDRLMYRLAYRHFSDGHESLVVAHAIGSPAGIRWYEIRNPYSPVIFQQGTFRPDSNWRWVPSMAMDAVGDIAVGYSESSANQNPSIYYAGRVPSDALGTLEPEINIVSGGGVESGNSRWGDYTSMSVDPIDDCTFWYANEYYKTSGVQNWTTRITAFKFPGCGGSSVTLSPSSLSFGAQSVNTTSSPQPITLTNNQSVALTINSVGISGAFAETDNCVSGSPIAAGGTCTINVTFTPTATGSASGGLTINDAVGPQTAPLSGTGVSAMVLLSTGSLTFPKTALGLTSAARTVTVNNTGTGPLLISSITASGNYNQTNNCPASLAPKGTCTITISFSPSTSGTITGEITIVDNAPNSPHLVTLSGLASIPLSMLPLNLGFGNVTVGSTSAAKAVTLTNNLTTALPLPFSVSGDYAISSTTCGSSLGAGASCAVDVKFSPGVNGNIKGAVTISSSGLASPQVIGLGGAGVSGTAGPLTFTPATLNFTGVIVGTTSALKTVVVTNSTTSTVHFSSISVSGDYSLVTGTGACGTSLAAGATCRIRVTFSPIFPGQTFGAVTIVDDAAISPQVINLLGGAALPVSLLPSPGLAFGAQAVGTTSAPLTLTISNNQPSTVLTLNNITASGDFAITTAATNPCGSSIPGNGSCNVGVVFSPVVSGAISGTITVYHNAKFGPQELGATGTGQ